MWLNGWALGGWRSKWSSHSAYAPGTDPVAHVASHALTPHSAVSRQRPPARSPGQLLGTSAQRQPASNAAVRLSVARAVQFTSCDVDCSVDFGDTKSYTERYIQRENYEVVNGSNRLCNLRLLTLIAQSNRGIVAVYSHWDLQETIQNRFDRAIM